MTEFSTGGGLSLGSVTELAGQPGVGKTQACIQWCVTVQWPSEFGGFRGRAIYLDCDANFFPERVHQVKSSVLINVPLTQDFWSNLGCFT